MNALASLLFYDRVYQFTMDDFELLLISDSLCSILLTIDGVTSQKHRIQYVFIVYQFARDDFKILLISDGLCSILR